MGDAMSDGTERRERAQQEARDKEARKKQRTENILTASKKVEDLRAKLKEAEGSIEPLRKELRAAEEALLAL